MSRIEKLNELISSRILVSDLRTINNHLFRVKKVTPFLHESKQQIHYLDSIRYLPSYPP